MPDRRPITRFAVMRAAAPAAGLLLLASCEAARTARVVDCWRLGPEELAVAAEDGLCLDAFARYVERTPYPPIKPFPSSGDDEGSRVFGSAREEDSGGSEDVASVDPAFEPGNPEPEPAAADEGGSGSGDDPGRASERAEAREERSAEAVARDEDRTSQPERDENRSGSASAAREDRSAPTERSRPERSESKDREARPEREAREQVDRARDRIEAARDRVEAARERVEEVRDRAERAVERALERGGGRRGRDR